MSSITRKRTLLLPVGILTLLLSLALATLPAPAFAASVDNQSTEAAVTFTPGNLQLVSAPNLGFGTHELSASVETYSLVKADNPVRVADLRGTAAGWKVTAALGSFKLDGTGQQTLPGSSITIAAPGITAANDTIGNPPALADQTIRLDSDGSIEKLLVAENGSGTGFWDVTLGPANTSLTVFPGASLGMHKATINWVLEDTP